MSLDKGTSLINDRLNSRTKNKKSLIGTKMGYIEGMLNFLKDIVKNNHVYMTVIKKNQKKMDFYRN